MNKIQAKRFKKLIAFLEELPREKFNFGEVISTCGTVGCAMGWTPKVFPKLVRWKGRVEQGGYGTVKSKVTNAVGFEKVANELFGINDGVNLFTPFDQKYIHHNLDVLSYIATPKQVAKMLKKYLKLKHPEHV